MTTDRSMRIALLLKALEDYDRELAEYKTGWKDRRAQLENQLHALKYEILSGQMSLVIEEGEKPNGAVVSEGQENRITEASQSDQ